MITFAEQLAATRTNLERLESLFEKHPGLFEHAYGIYLGDSDVKVYIHADRSPNGDWLAFARRWSDASWKREQSSVSGYDYRGTIGGVELVIISAEKGQQSQPLFQPA